MRYAVAMDAVSNPPTVCIHKLSYGLSSQKIFEEIPMFDEIHVLRLGHY